MNIGDRALVANEAGLFEVVSHDPSSMVGATCTLRCPDGAFILRPLAAVKEIPPPAPPPPPPAPEPPAPPPVPEPPPRPRGRGR